MREKAVTITIPEVESKSVNRIIDQHDIQNVLAQHGADEKFIEMAGRYYACLDVALDEYLPLTDQFRQELQNIPPAKVIVGKHYQHKPNQHTEAVWGFKHIDNNAANNPQESEVVIGLPWHSKAGDEITSAISALNDSKPIRVPLLAIEPSGEHFWSRKEVNKADVRAALGAWSCRFAQVATVEEYTQPYGLNSPLVCEGNLVFTSYGLSYRGTFSDPAKLSQDIASRRKQHWPEWGEFDINESLQLVFGHGLAWTPGYLYSRAPQLQALLDVVRYGTPLSADDPSMVRSNSAFI